MCISDGLIADYIEDFREKQAKPGLRKLVDIAPFPIVWFGNRAAYAASEARVVTVGLNPSCLEFEKGADRFRGLGDAGVPDPGRLANALDGYFREGGNPCRWFGKLESVLGGIHASYRENRGARAVALHVDACSAIATSKGWGKLDESQKRLLEDDGGRNLFRRLMDELDPDFILFSCNGNLVERYFPGFIRVRKIPYVTKAGKLAKRACIEMHSHFKRLLVTGPYANVPFGQMGNEWLRANLPVLLRRPAREDWSRQA